MIQPRLAWRQGRVVATKVETQRVKTLTLAISEWQGHLAGQHVDVRLTAPDGYQAARSYSIASAPGSPVQITVERLQDGEVSPYLVDEAGPGDQLEVRGPLGGYFVWRETMQEPILLIGGGSGIVPLMSMMRWQVQVANGVPFRLLFSSRTPEDVIYAAELDELAQRGVEIWHTFTRWNGQQARSFNRRIDGAMLHEVTWPAAAGPLAYTCGPSGFVERAASELVAIGYPPQRVRLERFGPSGT